MNDLTEGLEFPFSSEVFEFKWSALFATDKKYKNQEKNYKVHLESKEMLTTLKLIIDKM